MSRLTGLSIAEIQANRLEVARNFAREHELIVVLKGHRTLIARAAPDGTVWVNPTGNPGMATGGTGDILTGMIAGLIAQHPQHALEATALAVYLHGLAGDLASESVGENSLVATDLVRFLPQAFAETRNRKSEEIAFTPNSRQSGIAINVQSPRFCHPERSEGSAFCRTTDPSLRSG